MDIQTRNCTLLIWFQLVSLLSREVTLDVEPEENIFPAGLFRARVTAVYRTNTVFLQCRNSFFKTKLLTSLLLISEHCVVMFSFSKVFL